MKVTTAMVKELREATGAGVLDAKKALVSTDGDFDKAVEIIKKKGAVSAMSRVDREAAEGIVEVYPHPGNRVGVMLELNCETDFVARNDHFKTLAHELVLHIAAMSPLYIKREDVPADVLKAKKDEFQKMAEDEGKPPEIAEKIVQGRLEKYYEEVCLFDQPYVRDDSIKVNDLVLDAIGILRENVVVRRFARFELGQGSDD
ncbi:MAG: translation elongation factor Ts [Candidatus Promineifilaceae bacterium]|jgi:elongation factor Ts